MAERIDLTTPETKQIINWRVVSLQLFWLPPVIGIELLGSDGSKWAATYDEDTPRKASTTIVALNKANLTTKSLHRRILEMLQADFPVKFAGSISGSPD